MLILLGLRGSGKSTVGRLVAAGDATVATGVRAGPVPFVDLDDVTPLVAAGKGLVRSGSDLATVFTTLGEEGFRGVEADALGSVLGSPGFGRAVLALGGGTLTAERARAMVLAYLRSSGPASELVYLRASPSVLAERLAATDLSARPSLTGKGVLEEIGEVHAARDPLYLSLAQRVIEVDGLSVPEVARMLSR